MGMTLQVFGFTTTTEHGECPMLFFMSKFEQKHSKLKIMTNKIKQEDLTLQKIVLEKFPKKKIELPKVYQEIYEKHYAENRNGETKMSFLAQKMEEWLHKRVAKSSDTQKRTLEIGAGTLNQLKFERTSVYDIAEPFKMLFESSPELSKINRVYDDVLDIDSNEKYDRITSCATLEHITNLPEVVAKSCLLLNADGIFCASIPNEGRFLWKLGYKFTTGLEFKRRYNLNYETIMRYEHVNTADEIEVILQHFYKKVSRKLFGINKTFALYRYYECRDPYIERANDYLRSTEACSDL
jgi:2-polyprenyl-3-methyl-5-hydroxy-6-metoxy-1,4-benzoquinol methylase